MATIFTRIIERELPGHFVWEDEQCVSFLSIGPIRTGHALVVPRAEVDHWVDLDPELAAHLMRVARLIGVAQVQVWSPARIGLVVAGYEVPHTHLHVIPTSSMADLDFANVGSATAEELAAAAGALRDALTALGHSPATA